LARVDGGPGGGLYALGVEGEKVALSWMEVSNAMLEAVEKAGDWHSKRFELDQWDLESFLFLGSSCQRRPVWLHGSDLSLRSVTVVDFTSFHLQQRKSKGLVDAVSNPTASSVGFIMNRHY
jgi:hypothetical protein